MSNKAEAEGRFIEEIDITIAGKKVQFRHAVTFLGVFKIGTQFRVTVERSGVPLAPYNLELVQKRKDTFIHPMATFIGTVQAGNELLHFYAQPEGADQEERGLENPEDKVKYAEPQQAAVPASASGRTRAPTFQRKRD